MAAPAELSAERLRALPGSWSYGISQGGRVFFINEEAKSTTWLHPLTGEAVITGHRRSADLPTGWEEAYTFEGARYYVNHNERKVTCKHPVTGQPSQDNCIFVVNEQTAAAMTSEEKKERPVSMICEATNYNLTSDYAAHPMSPVGRTSRSSKKVHNFGKRSNSIKRNPNAPVVRRGWLYKQDSTGMKLWKKRWFVLSDLCLFYYRDEKEEGILGSILLPSFQISVLSAEDHINRKYAFKAAHPNMRTYYFCTDTGKEMELWMKAMTDAALVQTEPVKRVEKLTTENTPPREANNISNHRVLIKPDAQNNQKNKEVNKNEEKKALEAEKYGFQKVGQDKPLTKINSVKLNPLGSEYRTLPISMIPAGHFRPVHLNGSENKALGVVLAEAGDGGQHNVVQAHMESERVMQRTNSMLQLEQWIKIQRGKGQEEETRGIISYQTLPRNMPSHRPQVLPRYPEGYRTLPRNSKARPESLCSVTPSGYDRAVGPVIAEEKRRSMRDDTMWQLYEWQQRQFYNKQTTLTRHSTLSSPKTMINISDQTMHSIPTSPSHGSIAGFQGYSPQRTYRSEVSSPVQRGDITIDRRHRTHHTKHVFVPDRRSMPAGLSLQPVTPQSLQGKTPEELTLLLIKLRRQQAELSSIREHTLAQLMQLKLEASSPKLTQEECRGTLYKYRTEELDIDAKLSHLCEQDKVVQALEEKLQQLHKEKYTLEQALLSASQEIEMNADNPAAIQSVVLQRDDLQNGLLSTCREVSRATAELERAWREYDKLEYDVTVTRNHMQEQLDRLGEIQTESAGIQRAQIQKELWRIQDVMEGLSKHKQQRSSSEAGIMGSRTFSTIKYKNEGPDYRLYKSEPELTTVAEVDESNGEEKTEQISESESAAKGSHFPVGVVPPRTKSPTPESSTIASYVTLRKNKKIDLRTERPRSAVEQLCLAESTRPRMTVEEQMERIKRHQQACLREKRKGLNIIGVSDQSPSQSLSFVRDNPFKLAQNRKKDDTVSSNMKELERTSKENNLKQNNGSPGEEIAQLKHDGEQEHNSGFTKELTKTGDLLSDTHVVSDSKEVSNEEKAEKEKKNKLEETHDGDISLQSVTTVTNHKPKTSSEESEVVSIQEQEGIMSSFELAAQSSKGNQATAVKSLPSSPESSLSPAPSTQTQLTEGSHFITNGFY
ncbi:pleckstrin homology domain-containing family A member 5 isoform X10 [Falco biarmicus]|uniref:pleckstrin homology domain-containing family A member 5 isoform X9 n=1 Tax=Falco rusticolus TaxID=120794 RepID=UPI0018867277|nr:pleckstrin homology domain-containing family A member 5 isoform X9 [Falco rusticolus]XP_055567655.1 pleckstrin homology domain-containing family A member 5 isoform X10 [Falco cherrug]XP_055664081.1 pleckstrin homology domain-containing family A member 5 isoform X10 [Falco peregrinus]XP_056196500.1 pleckstrin homology domain-containing family A member 5 isoform X10 [Falco biarmicus]